MTTAARPSTTATRPSRRPSPFQVVSITALFFLVVLILSAGLGLNFKNAHMLIKISQPLVTNGPPLPGRENGTWALENWRLDTEEYVLDMTWDFHASPVTRYVELVITQGVGWPDGVVRQMLFINGHFPGPLIELNRGDRLIVNVTNMLISNATTIHWHGIFQNGTNWFDGVHGITQCGIPPGDSFVYNFIVDNQYGTYWYHSHYGSQYLDGILGPLIVHAPEEAEVRKTYHRDEVILVQDWYHDPSSVNIGRYLAPNNENNEPVPDNGLINGQGFFNCSKYVLQGSRDCFQNSTYFVLNLNPKRRTRLRLINVGALAEFDFGIDNHTLSVIEADGTPTSPHEVHRVPIHVGQRYSIVVETNQAAAANYWVRAHMNTWCMGENPILDPIARAVLVYAEPASGFKTNRTPGELSVDWMDDTSVVCKDLDDRELAPSIYARPPPATHFMKLDFSFGIGPYQMSYADVNGTTWKALENMTTLLQAMDGQARNSMLRASDGDQTAGVSRDQFIVPISNSEIEVVDVLLYSMDEGSHPFHLHGHSFWILESGSGPFDWANYYQNVMPSRNLVVNPLRRDTVTVPSYSWTLVRFVADNPGVWALHCHIAWHIEAGMMMQFLSRADVLSDMDLPTSIREMCAP